MAPAIDLSLPAAFGDEGLWRWFLSRDVSMFGPPVCLIGYNPSRADAERNDPTIRREVDFAARWGCGRLLKVNAFAGVATDPDDLFRMHDPVGLHENDAWIRAAAEHALAAGGMVVAVWGAPKGRVPTRRMALERFERIKAMGLPLHAIRITASGFPEHPLYLPAELRPVPWWTP